MSKLVKVLVAVIIVTTSIGIIGCGGTSSGNETKVEKTEEVGKEKNNNEEEKQDKESGLYQMKLGEVATISGDDGDYELTIEGVRVTDERNQFNESNPITVFFLDYNYKNIDCVDDLMIFGGDFKIMDGEGNMLSTYPVSDFNRMGKSCPQGGKSKASVAFGIESDSKEIKVLYYDNMFMDPVAEIKITIE